MSGDPTPGGTIEFSFGGPDRTVAVEVSSAVPDEQVIWRCVHGPDEWIDTTLEFELEATPGETVVRFAHAGWREPVEFMGHCTHQVGLLPARDEVRSRGRQGHAVPRRAADQQLGMTTRSARRGRPTERRGPDDVPDG